MRTVYTRKAKSDLIEIRDYYGSRSPQALQNIVSDIVTVVDELPGSIAKGRRTPHPEVWEKISPRYGYLLPYSVQQGQIYILRVYDARREALDYEAILDLEE